MEGLDNVKDSIISVLNSIWDVIKQIPGKLLDIIENIKNGFLDLGQRVIELPCKIIELLKELFELLFVPEKTPVDDIKDIIDKKFPVINQITDIVNGLFVKYGDTTATPRFTVTYKGQTYNILNLDWYIPYRNIVCGIIICIAWLSFVFWLVRFVPKMLGGVN